MIKKDIVIDLNSIGVDVGFLYKLSSKHQFAFLINSLHTKYTWDVASLYEEKFPRILSFGGSSKIGQSILSIYQIDYSLESKKPLYKFGLELDIFSMKNIPMDVRLGLNSKNDSFNPSFGFGYKIFMKKIVYKGFFCLRREFNFPIC